MKVYNFSAGPSVLPSSVLEKARDELICYKESGISVMEMSHRSKDYEGIINSAEADLRELLNIPDNYKVIFMQGGASTQFASVPLNLTKNGKADYISTGMWSKRAIKEAQKYTKVNVVASSEDKIFSYIPEITSDMLDDGADYLHITMNNTIYGTRYVELPDAKVPIVADFSSCILSEQVDVSKFGVIYASAQKNMGPAGVTVVIIREDLLGNAPPSCPTMSDYKIHADNGSMYNTPPTFSIYICGLVLKWIKSIGGIEAIEKINIKKAALLYDYLDNSSLFKPTVSGKQRSIMNIPFITGKDEIDEKFIKEAKSAGFINLKGHRSVGGMRASIYNAMEIEGITSLIEFMKEFEGNLKK